MKYFHLSISILFLQNTFAQNYADYYKTCYQGDSLMYKKEYGPALEKYKAAFSTVNYIHYRNLESATECAIEVEDFESAYRYIRQSIINSGKTGLLSVYKRVPSWKFKRTKSYKNIKDRLDIFRCQYENGINEEYNSILDSLYFIDQYVIRGTRHAKRDYDVNVDSLRKIRHKLDSSNFQTFLECVDKWGWPTENTIRDEYYMLVIHHNMRLKENEKYHEIAFKAVREGKYNPKILSWWYEQYYLSVMSRTFFTTWDKDLSEENLNRINANRKKYYLKPLTSIKLKKGGSSMKSIW